MDYKTREQRIQDQYSNFRMNVGSQISHLDVLPHTLGQPIPDFELEAAQAFAGELILCQSENEAIRLRSEDQAGERAFSKVYMAYHNGLMRSVLSQGALEAEENSSLLFYDLADQVLWVIRQLLNS